MQTDYVKEFLMVTKTLNYAEAADKLYISRSTLFKHIKALEDDLGGTLFNRDGHSITLSAYGRIFLPYAKRLVSAERQCASALERWKKAEDYGVTVQTDYKILDLICQFREKYPQYQVNNTEAEISSEESLVEGRCDLALLCGRDLDPDEYVRVPLCKDYMAAVLPANHPLAARQVIRLNQLMEENFIALTVSGAHNRYWDKAFEEAGFMPKVVMTCARGTAVTECISHNVGCSVMMEKLTRNQNNPAIAVIRLEPEIEIDISFWLLRNKKRSAATQAFIEYIQAYRERLS